MSAPVLSRRYRTREVVPGRLVAVTVWHDDRIVVQGYVAAEVAERSTACLERCGYHLSPEGIEVFTEPHRDGGTHVVSWCMHLGGPQEERAFATRGEAMAYARWLGGEV